MWRGGGALWWHASLGHASPPRQASPATVWGRSVSPGERHTAFVRGWLCVDWPCGTIQVDALTFVQGVFRLSQLDRLPQGCSRMRRAWTLSRASEPTSVIVPTRGFCSHACRFALAEGPSELSPSWLIGMTRRSLHRCTGRRAERSRPVPRLLE